MVDAPLSRLWTDRCDIYVQVSQVNGQTGRTEFIESEIYTELPCRISFRLTFETVGSVKDAGGMATAANQSAKLFISSDIEVPPGAKVVVRGRGREMAFAKTGVPAVFQHHQEIRLEKFEGWA